MSQDKAQNERGISSGKQNTQTLPAKRNHLFVIGIDQYPHLEARYQLSNAVKDAQAVVAALTERYVFASVQCLTNAQATHAAIFAQLQDYENNLTAEDNLVIYFAGHGYRYRGKEFTLLSTDFREETVNERKIPKDGIKQSDLFPQLEDIKVHQLLLILDSCFSGSIFRKTRGFGATTKDEKSPCRIGITAGKDDEVVSDGIINRNSPFAAALIDILKTNTQPTLRTDTIRTQLKEALADQKQKPCCEPLNLDGHEVGAEFVLFLKETESPEKVLWNTAQRTPSEEGGYVRYLRQYSTGEFAEIATTKLRELTEDKAWQKAKRGGTGIDYLDYLAIYPNGKYAEEANKQLDIIENQPVVPIKPVVPAPKPPPLQKESFGQSPKQSGQIQLPTIIIPKPKLDFEPDMILIKGGTFQMGSNEYNTEKPIHAVTLPDFYLGKYPITQAQWQAVMGENPSYSKGENLPVDSVSWDDTQAFLEKLNEKTGKTYRLPTEAEWEFAARGGISSKGYKYSGSNTFGDVAWYTGNSDSKAHPVGGKAANELGLHDMSGNVWEWCQDQWHPDYKGAPTDGSAWLGQQPGSNRVLRGGSWINNGQFCRSAYRGDNNPDNRNSNNGFRVVFVP